jgi:hypothetical protein
MRFICTALLALGLASAAVGQTRLRPREASVSASIVAGIASTPGQAGTHYVSSLSLANPHPFAVTVTAYVLPAGVDNSDYRASARTIDLPANGGTRIDDPLASLWSKNGLASLYLESTPSSGNDGAFVVESRVTNVANPAATFGLAIPGTLSGVTDGDVGLGPDVESDAAYRTNFGLFNDWSQSADVRVELLGDDGAVLGAATLTLEPYSLEQHAVSEIVPAAFSRATLRVTPPAGYGGQVVGYTAVVDNATGDGASAMLHTYRLPDPGSAEPTPVLVTVSRYAFSPGGPADPPIRLQAGTRYRITFHATDTEHGVSTIPQLGIDATAIAPGADYVVVVAPTAAQRGRYNFACTRVCGSGHGGMYGAIEVE